MLKEFKKFIMRGNVIDMAVGVIVGGAFNSLVQTLINDVAVSYTHLDVYKRQVPSSPR